MVEAVAGAWRYNAFLASLGVIAASAATLLISNLDNILDPETLHALGIDSSPNQDPVARGSLAPQEFQPTPNMGVPDSVEDLGPESAYGKFQTSADAALVASEFDQQTIEEIARRTGRYLSGCFQRASKEIDTLQAELLTIQTEVKMAALSGPEAGNAEATKNVEHARSICQRLDLRMRDLMLLATGKMYCT